MTYGDQLKKLQNICSEALEQFHFYDNEVEAEIKEGVVINKDLSDKLTQAENLVTKAIFNYQTLQVFCHKNKIDIETFIVPYE